VSSLPFRLPLAIAALALAACAPAGAPESPAQQQADYRKQATTALEASDWRLGSWQPEQPLEPMLQALLAQQLATMTVHFGQGRVRADSPTIHIDRAYQVVDASGPQFVVVTTDAAGGTLRTTAQLSDDGRTVNFHGETEPWRGNGTLVKGGGTAP
jgi:hypothetical protein